MISCAINCLTHVIFSKWTFLVAILVYFAYKWSTATYDFYKKRGNKFIPPLPLVGNFKDVAFLTIPFTDLVNQLYNHFPNEKFYGVFVFRDPIMLIRDPELIKQLTIKDFDHFLDHRFDFVNEPLFGRNLLGLKGQEWKNMRSTLSPAFTGSKMRTMFQLVSECCSETVNYLEKESIEGKPILTDLKDLFTRFTNDVIATCAFGIKVDSRKDRENEFYLYGKKFTDFGSRSIIFLLVHLMPTFCKIFGIKLFPDKFCNFFRNLVWDTIRYREKENIIRPDMINLLIQARKGKLKYDDEDIERDSETNVGEAINQTNFEEDDLTAQCLIFFIAGFESTSTCMCFTAYELAANPEVQQRLIEEVDATKEMLGGKPVTYDALHNMKYLDMVISESLRQWPPSPGADRKCVKHYTFKSDDIDFEMNEGEGIMIPIYGLHHDPKHFPDPFKFDPERFSDENKDKITPFTYLPFGVGPRNCIGSRFALMETKAIIYYILTKFTFEVSEKTQVPMKLKAGVTLQPEKGFWVHLKPRNQ
ncbi:probable cytochrome P450 9f2 [Phlebotomus argentipes]|uniref:probable cytochrome P450 9f2 n=1 Tax=Phlebotomus argentipes TaxID=94469 RepID=UPI0028936835|nr:probable cytochrome P450 9f2 [Phlebotomus argentipes]